MLRMNLSRVNPFNQNHHSHSSFSLNSNMRRFASKSFIELPNKELFYPYQIEPSLWEQIQQETSELNKRLPLAIKILHRIEVDAMSIGSLSPNTHGHIAKAVMALAGAKTHEELIKKFYSTDHLITSNCGEGGDINQHLEKQVASARFGVTLDYLIEAVIAQFKAAQGVKPGVGGSLAGIKVSDLIAFIRNCTPWTDLHSPGPHADQYSIEDFGLLVSAYMLANPRLAWSVKLASEPGVDTIALGCLKAMGLSEQGRRNNISITGQGGTGNTPIFTKYHAAFPWFVGLGKTHSKLVEAGVRDQVTLTASGGMTGQFFTPFLWGADRVGIGSLALVGDGCIMIRKCHDNTCPTGVATMDPKLMAKNNGNPLSIARVLLASAELTALEMQPYFDDVDQAIGRAPDILEAVTNGPLTGHEQYLTLLKKKPRFISLGKLPRQKGPSYKENEIIEDIRQKKTSHFFIHADNSEMGFGARLSYYSRTNNEVKDVISSTGVTLNFSGFTGQNWAVLGGPGIIYNGSDVHTNDGTGKSLSGAKVFAKTCGNQAGFAMTEGFFSTLGVGSRGAVRKSGGTFVTEYAGAFFANFHTRDNTYLLGGPKHYPNLEVDSSYRPPFAFKEHALGFGFLSGFSGGKIIMPRSLWQEALELNHVSPSIRPFIKPVLLGDDDKKELLKTLDESIQYLNSVLQKAIVKAIRENPHLIDEWFVKLEAPLQKIPELGIGQIALVEEKLPLPARKPSVSSSKVIDNEDAANLSMVSSPDREHAACGTGLMMDLDGHASHEMIRLATQALVRSAHRGASAADPLTGDGCGMMIFFGDGFFQAQPECKDLHLVHGQFGVMAIFMPKNANDFVLAEQALVNSLKLFGLQFSAKRNVPINEEKLGILAKEDQIVLMQYIIPHELNDLAAFDKSLSLAHLSYEFTAQQMDMSDQAHVCSASRQYVVYKTKGKEKYFADIYPDLSNPSFTASVTMIHSRFATNTATLKESVQPFGAMFNGEINNIRRFIEEIKYNRKLSELLKIDLTKINFSRYSDSAIMSFYIKMLQLQGYDSQQIHDAIFHAYDPRYTDSISAFHDLIGMPGLEGPNGSIRVHQNKITIEMDAMGYRPHRGMIDEKRRLLVTGSELGIVPDLNGEVLELGPGDAFEIDLTNKTYVLLKPQTMNLEKFSKKLSAIEEVRPSKSYEHIPFTVTLTELQERKLKAGLTPEIENTFLQPMFNGGKGLIGSMADDGGPEVIVPGPTRVINTVKPEFAQITRPPLDFYREGEVMTGMTFIGGRPALEHLHTFSPKGFSVKNPIIDNDQMHFLLTTEKLTTTVIDIIYPVRGRELAMLKALERICKTSVDAVEQGATFLVLSDIKTDALHAALLPMFVSGMVDLALRKAGLRHQVTLCLQSSICATPLEQITSIALGINIINPYLIFMPDKLYETDKQTFIRQRQSYQEVALKELLAAAARCGTRTISAGYQGARLITALGLDKEVANSIGIHSELGGLDWANIAATMTDAHFRPASIGKYQTKDNLSRPRKWNVELVNLWRSIAKGEKTLREILPLMRKNIKNSDQTTLEGWFKMKPPQIWTPENPMPVIIVGGGAAGFMQAQALLDSVMGKKIKILIIEENPANLFGRIKDGIAPDKLATRKTQFKLLSQCLSDPRVEYYGGVSVGDNGEVTFDELIKDSPCVIDCRGAPHDRLPTDIEGHQFFISASKVWKAYNGFFDPFNPNRYWPFNEYTRSQVKIVVGNGNVAADVIRLLLANPDHLHESDVHPLFQERLRKQGPKFIRNIARGSVTQCKITLKELESFEKNGIRVCASFSEAGIDETKLTEEQLQKLQFFRKAKENSHTLLVNETCVHFHFGCVPKKVYSVGKNILELEVINENNKTETFRGGDFISAIGTEKPAKEFATPFIAGWASGHGGNLAIIQKDVEKNTAKILAHDEQRGFDHQMGPAPERKWQQTASVTNQGLRNILSYCNDHHPLDTIEHWRKARDYYVADKQTAEHIDNEPQKNRIDSVNDKSIMPVLLPDNTLSVVHPHTKKSMHVAFEETNVSVYRALKKASAVNPEVPVPENECDESGSCIRCVGEVTAPKVPIKQTSLEKSQLPQLFGPKAKNKFLTCQHSVAEVVDCQGTVSIEYPMKKMK